MHILGPLGTYVMSDHSLKTIRQTPRGYLLATRNKFIMHKYSYLHSIYSTPYCYTNDVKPSARKKRNKAVNFHIVTKVNYEDEGNIRIKPKLIATLEKATNK